MVDQSEGRSRLVTIRGMQEDLVADRQIRMRLFANEVPAQRDIRVKALGYNFRGGVNNELLTLRRALKRMKKIDPDSPISLFTSSGKTAISE